MSPELGHATKCPNCGREYDQEYERLGEDSCKQTEHLAIIQNHSFQDSWGTQYAWTVQVKCKCGTVFNFDDST